MRIDIYSSIAGTLQSVIWWDRCDVRLHPQLLWLLHGGEHKQRRDRMPPDPEWDHLWLWQCECLLCFIFCICHHLFNRSYHMMCFLIPSSFWIAQSFATLQRSRPSAAHTWLHQAWRRRATLTDTPTARSAAQHTLEHILHWCSLWYWWWCLCV